MTRIRAVLISGAAVLAMAVPASAAHHVKSCGDINSAAFNVKAKGVTCKKARRVARKYDGELGKRDATPFGFKCKSKNLPKGTGKVTCTKHHKVVKWHWESVG